MKIFIIGPAGSGKTTLAEQLSELLNYPHTDLDDLFWDNQKDFFEIKREDTVRNKMYEKLLSQKSWIIEGAYLSWPSDGFSLADKLIFLDLKPHVLSFRIIKRFIRRKPGVDNCREKETLKSLVKLLKWNKKQAVKMKDHFLLRKRL